MDNIKAAIIAMENIIAQIETKLSAVSDKPFMYNQYNGVYNKLTSAIHQLKHIHQLETQQITRTLLIYDKETGSMRVASIEEAFKLSPQVEECLSSILK